MAVFTIALLAGELTSDPQTVGYSGAVTDAAKSALVNQRTGNGSASVFRNDIKTAEIVNAIVAADFAVLTAVQVQKLALMLQAGILDATQANVRTIFLGIFAGMANTITALTALASRTGSRAEVLWGCGTVVTEQQIGQARNGQ